MRLTPRCLAALSLFVVLTIAAVAAKKEDPLARVTPVPADQPIPITDFFRPGVLRRPIVNAAGTHVVCLVALAEDREGLFIVDLATMKGQTLQGGRDQDVYWFNWLTDDRILFSVSRDKLFAEGLYVADVKNPRRNYVLEQYSVVSVVGRPHASRTKPLVWVRHNAYEEGKDAGVMQIDAMRNLARETPVVPGTRGTKDDSAYASYGINAPVLRSFARPPEGLALAYMSDAKGDLAFVMTIGAGEKLLLFAFDDGKWTPCPVDLELFDIEDVGDQPGEIIVLGPAEAGKPRALYRMNALTGQLGDVLTRDDEYDCENVSLHRDYETGRILGVTYAARTEKTVWFDADRQRVQGLVAAQFPGQVVNLIDADKAGDRFVVQTYSDRHPVAYHTVHLSQRGMGLLKNSRPWIDPQRMRPHQIVSYKARDGAKIEGYLTLPDGASKERPAPLVVLPHGGPWVRDTWGWDPDVQFLASRGYAVFQPNYRGSTGYDWKFKNEDLEDFRKMHEDVTDGVKAMLTTGLLDPARIAIMGGSFGGYLAVCGAAFEPGLYRCAVTMSGVFDWELMLAAAKRDHTRHARYKLWLKRIGDPKTQGERLAAVSPLRHIDQVKIPVFVQHGREDSVVAIEQSKRLVSELQEHGVPHVARFDKDEGHGTFHFENRVELYSEIEAFLAKYLAK